LIFALNMGTAQSTGSEEAHERAGDGGRDLDAKLQQGLPAKRGWRDQRGQPAGGGAVALHNTGGQRRRPRRRLGTTQPNRRHCDRQTPREDSHGTRRTAKWLWLCIEATAAGGVEALRKRRCGRDG
jgi:hypothetical protein